MTTFDPIFVFQRYTQDECYQFQDIKRILYHAPRFQNLFDIMVQDGQKSGLERLQCSKE